MSYRAWEPNAIGSIVPPFAGGSGGGGGGGNNDRFAPKYLVGNVPAGDTATTTGTAAGFTYLADPGDGSGIEAALAACAAAGGGDVWIRPGTYDLDTGRTAAPLVIPPNTRVQGAGQATLVRGKKRDVQTVFELAQDVGGGPAFSSLRDLTVEVPEPVEETSGPEAAVVVLAGGTVINGVSIGVEAGGEGIPALTAGILINTADSTPFPATSIESVTVAMRRSTLPTKPGTAAIRLREGQVNARNFTLVGGGELTDQSCDVAIQLINNNTDPQNAGGCLFFGSQFFCINIGQYGVLTEEDAEASRPTAVRLSDGVFVGPGGPTAQAAPPLGAGTDQGARLEASFVSTFRSVIFFGWSTGVVIEPPAPLSASAQIDDCGILICDLGVLFAEGSIDSSVSDTNIGTQARGAPFATTAQRGVEIRGQGIAVTNNTIHTSDYLGSGAVTSGARASKASNVFVEGNEFQHLDGGNAAAEATVWIDASTFSQNVVVADNHLTSDNPVAAILLTAPLSPQKRVVISNNTITLPSAAQPPYGIDVAGLGCALVGNAVDQSAMQAVPCAAIRVTSPGQAPTATRCTVAANTIQPSTSGAGPAILIESDENACSTNACSLAAPPATAAIQISGNNNTCLANVCRTAPTVLNTGAGNEVAHNI